MSKEKSPFKSYTVEQILMAESCSYVIQVEGDLYEHDGNMVFSKRSAAIYYNKILNNLLDIIDGGDEEERQDAFKCLCTLQIMPLRIN